MLARFVRLVRRGKSEDKIVETVADCIVIPENARESVHQAVGLDPEETLRISYLPGPGDLETTYDFWAKGEFDPRVPSIAYSTMFFELCERLGAEAQVIVRGPGAPETTQKNNIRFEKVTYEPGDDRISYIFDRSRYARDCMARVEAFDPHLAVVATDFPWRFFPILAKGRRLILSVHNSLWPMGTKNHPLRRQLKNAFLSRWLRAINTAVSTSHECHRQISSLTGSRLDEIVAVPQQQAPAQTAETEISAESDGRKIFYLGRIEENKGVFDLLSAFETIRVKHPDVTLAYAGDGSALPLLRDQIAERELQETAAALGRLDSNDVHKALANSYLLACPTRTSFNEGLAFVCFEAALHGVPTVMSEVVPANELLAGGCVVVKPDSVTSLVTAFDAILSDKEHYENLRRVAREKSTVVFDRSRSWGSQLYSAIVGITP